MRKSVIVLCVILMGFGSAGVASATAITIANPSFEEGGALGPPYYAYAYGPIGWDSIIGNSTYIDSGALTSQPWYGVTAPAGTNVGWLNANYNPASFDPKNPQDLPRISQWLNGMGGKDLVSLVVGTTYTLTLDVAGAPGYTTGATYQLWFAGLNPGDNSWVNLAISDAVTPTEGSFSPAQLAYTFSDADYAGWTFGFALVVGNTNDPFKSELNKVTQVLFDNVRLDASSAVPEPATILLVGIGLVGVGILGNRKFRK
jgi:hypothetical protein